MEINRNTYEEFFLLYVDGELNAGERKAVENFAEQHPDLKKELELLKSSVLIPDNALIFEKKEELYKKYQKMPEEVKEGRTLRVKLVRMYLKNLEDLINSDNDIEFVSGSATLTPSDSYSDSA